MSPGNSTLHYLVFAVEGKIFGHAEHSRVEEDYSCARIVTELAKAKTNGNKNAIA